jgi:hypothetical protein
MPAVGERIVCILAKLLLFIPCGAIAGYICGVIGGIAGFMVGMFVMGLMTSIGVPPSEATVLQITMSGGLILGWIFGLFAAAGFIFGEGA